MPTWNGRGEDGPAAEVLFEFTQIGVQMRVAAIDVRSRVEVVVITPASASRADMQALALGKLKRRLSAPR
jgi:hypothetical protein